MISTGGYRIHRPEVTFGGSSPAVKPGVGQPSLKDNAPLAGQTAPLESFTPSQPAGLAELSGSAKRQGLSKSDKKALQEAFREGHFQSAQRHAVVIGGGPGGLAAAISLAQNGMKVTVLEARANEAGDKPAHARTHQISLRQDSLETLKRLGAYDDVIANSGFVEHEHHIRGDHENQVSHSKKPEGKAQDHDRWVLDPRLLHTDSVSQVRISDVEKALLKQAEGLGIEVRSGVQASLHKAEGSNSYGVSIRNVAKNGTGGYKEYGEATDLGVPDLVVAADGAGSPTRAALGIEVSEESASKHYLGGHIQKGIGATTRKAAITEESGMRRHMMGTGHAKYDQTWVSVEITPEEAKLPPEKRAELLADKAQWVMGEEISTKDIGWGAGQLTTVQNRRAKTTTAGDNVVLIGDAAGTGSVWVGGGLNLALTTHLSALKSLSTRIQNGADTGAAMQIYDRTLQWATTTWHRAGASELGGVNTTVRFEPPGKAV